MGLSAAEKNRRKRERKKKEKEERRKRELEERKAEAARSKEEKEDDVVIEYVSEDLSEILKKTTEPGTKPGTKPDPKPDPQPPTTTTSRPDGLPPAFSEPETDDDKASSSDKDSDDNNIEDVLRRFHQRAAVVPSASDGNDDDDDVDGSNKKSREDQSSVVSNSDDDYDDGDDDDDADDDDEPAVSKRKLREMTRPTVAELKRRVQRPDLVEAHDVTGADPDFLIALKGIPHTTAVPFHWGRKRKYLQGKRGFEKIPYRLPDFIVKTGIADVRDTAMEDEADQSAKQKNRGRVNPKMGTMDVDYKILYDAFFQFQTKPESLTSWGDLYYEGREMENSTDIKPGGPFSKALRIALGMGGGGGGGNETNADDADDNNTPPPWLWNMQRYGPPPSHPRLKIPGLNAPLPNHRCQYGYHPGGWGKPPVDAYGRPLYGGNPLDPPGSGRSGTNGDNDGRELVTSDGKTVLKLEWGGLPTGIVDALGGGAGDDDDSDSDSDMEGSSSDDESGSESGQDMDESDAEEGDGDDEKKAGTESVLPPPPPDTIDDIRKQTAGGDETPFEAPKRLYQVLETGSAAATAASSSEGGGGGGGIFRSDVRYVVPGAAAAAVPEGAESVLSKAVGPPRDGNPSSRKKRKPNNNNAAGDDEDDELEKNFKF